MTSNGTWNVVASGDAQRRLRRIPLKDAERILAAFRGMEANPYEGDIEKLGGEENRWRRRVGAYRICYRLYPREKTVLVTEVKRRGSHTY